MTVSDLPRIVAYDGVDDSGEFGNATCPHCGAKGRYVHRFTVADGRHLAAMAGCIKLFPTSPLAAEHQKIVARQKERDAKGYRLASWDIEKLAAIDAVRAGTLSEADALAVVDRQNRRRAEWQSKKGRR